MRARVASLVCLLSAAPYAGCVGNGLHDGKGADGAASGQDGANPNGAAPLFPFEPVPESVYVTKVKSLLTGYAADQNDINAVQKDPNALAGLVGQWMDTPNAKSKLRAFYAVALQQVHQLDTDFTPQGTPDSGDSLRDNLRNSMALTVESIVAQNQPFTEVVTSHQYMMTTAMMSFLAYNDQLRSSDTGRTRCPFGCAPKWSARYRADADGGPIPLSDSLDPSSANYMVFAAPAPYNCRVPALDSTGHVILTSAGKPTYNQLPYNERFFAAGTDAQLFALLQGRRISYTGTHPLRPEETVTVPSDAPFDTIPYYKVYCSDGVDTAYYLPASDSNDWRLVTVRAANPNEVPTRFWDMGALRKQNTLVTGTPRVGFFSQPAFLATAPTNLSNDARVTTNQTLIVALGRSIDPTDKTAVISLGGKDGDHADPTSPCYACHRSLDPMREVMRKAWTYNYHVQENPNMLAYQPSFEFSGVNAPMSSLDDFASTLVTHPLFPTAWVQKICFWANSAPCSADDPAFVALAASFAKDNFNFRNMLINTLSSPIVTGRTVTKTRTDTGEVVSVSRFNHLCISVTARFGLTDALCSGVTPAGLAAALSKEVAGELQLVNGNIPVDGFGRGAESPVLPTQPTMFFRGAAEALCSAAAALAVDQPGSLFQSANVDQATNDMVYRVMGVAAGDPAAASFKDGLTAHYNDAKATGATATLSLRSALVVACLTAPSLGLGL